MIEATRIVGDKDVVAGLNASGSTIAKGRVVLGTGTAEDEIALATAASQAFLGVTTESIANNTRGGVQIRGKAVCVAGAAVTKGVRVTSDGAGKVIAAAGGDATLGIAASAAAALDEEFEVWIGSTAPRMPG